ncbi:hypothetical protein M9978_07950 [Sphingomonas sp. MG17]|uniref:Uncharacterized protein n=2 Tax=Sphingomonas tagetis TaxID=2949092 RepID=A0A9X2KL34_9SPHN|nr:hypothetical protein [Sphingomonas tagetis]
MPNPLLVFFVAYFLLVSGFAFWKGGAPERFVAGSFLTAWVLSIALSPAKDVRFQTVEVGILAIDLTLLVVLTGVALRANRRWTIVTAGLQLVIVMAHLAKAADPRLIQAAYAYITESWPILQITVLAVGTELYRCRRRCEGSVRSWSRSSRR